MSQGRDFAKRLLVWPLAALVLGCRPWLAVHRVDPALDPRILSRPQGVQAVQVVAQPVPAVVQAAPPYHGQAVPLPPLPLVPVSDGEALGPSHATPMLDAALARAQAVQTAVVEGPAAPTAPAPDLTPPTPNPPEPATTPQVAPVAPDESRPPSDEPPDESPPAGNHPEPEPEPEADSTAEPSPEPAEPPPAASDAEPPTTVPELGIAELRLCRKVLGFGRFEPADRDAFRPGGPVLIYCEMAGLSYQPCDEAGEPSFRSVLESTIEIRPEDGEEPVWRQHLGTAEDLCRRPRRDYYVNYRVTLPDAATLPPGTYHLRLIQKDTLTGATASRALTLRIEAERP
jgi:hypothetical protein